MRKPTPREKLYRWHTDAVTAKQFGLEVEINPDEPQCGWFKRRLVKGGVFVPARVWMHQPVDQDGELVGEEVLQCETDGQCRDANDQWSWLADNPITESEFNFLTATRKWCTENAPHEPYANPGQPVDWHNVPIPTFTKEPTP